MSNQDGFVEQLCKDNMAMKRAGCKLAEAALYVAREYDGVHRLLIAVSEWVNAIADEGGRKDKKEFHKLYFGDWHKVYEERECDVCRELFPASDVIRDNRDGFHYCTSCWREEVILREKEQKKYERRNNG